MTDELKRIRDEGSEKSVAEYLRLIYPSLEKAGIDYSEDQLEHCADDNFKAGFDFALTQLDKVPEVMAIRDELFCTHRFMNVFKVIAQDDIATYSAINEHLESSAKALTAFDKLVGRS